MSLKPRKYQVALWVQSETTKYTTRVMSTGIGPALADKSELVYSRKGGILPRLSHDTGMMWINYFFKMMYKLGGFKYKLFLTDIKQIVEKTDDSDE